VEVCRRTGEGREVFVLINHGDRSVHVDIPAGARIVLSDGASSEGSSSIEFPPQGVLLLQR
jgi:beta-galactosidase